MPTLRTWPKVSVIHTFLWKQNAMQSVYRIMYVVKKLHRFSRDRLLYVFATATTTALSSLIFVIKTESFCQFFLWQQKCNAELEHLYWITSGKNLNQKASFVREILVYSYFPNKQMTYFFWRISALASKTKNVFESKNCHFTMLNSPQLVK